MRTFQTDPNFARFAELKVVYKRRKRIETSQPMNCPILVADFVRPLFNPDTIEIQEEVIAVFLDTALRPVGWIRVALGGMTFCNIDPKIIFAAALSCGATGLLIAHNHPSGDPDPSKEDHQTTKQMKAASQLLGIRFLDHVILTKEKSFSFALHGLT